MRAKMRCRLRREARTLLSHAERFINVFVLFLEGVSFSQPTLYVCFYEQPEAASVENSHAVLVFACLAMFRNPQIISGLLGRQAQGQREVVRASEASSKSQTCVALEQVC